jgi:hypothetical protein
MAEGVIPHYCSACGELHGGSHGKNPEIEIAKINAERDIQVAKLARNEFKPTEAELENRVELAEVEAGAQVATAEALGGGIAEAGPEVVVEAPSSEETEPEIDEIVAEEEPPEVTSSPTPREPKKTSWWDNYK